MVRGCVNLVVWVQRGSNSAIAYHGDDGADWSHFTLLDPNLFEYPGGGGGDFHGNLVRLDLEQVVARRNGIAYRFEPDRDLSLGYGLAELGHQDVHTKTPLTGV